MDQGLVTIVVGLISASAAIVAPIAQRAMENKGKDKRDQRLELEQLASRYRSSCERLWEANGDLLLAYWDRVLLDDGRHSSKYVEPCDRSLYYSENEAVEEDIRNAENAYYSARDLVEGELFSLAVKYPKLQESAKELFDKADHQPRQDPFDRTVFGTGLKRIIIESDDGGAELDSALQQQYDEAVVRFTEKVQSEYKRLK